MEKHLFEKYFTLPFKLDKWGMYVWDATGSQMVLVFDDAINDLLLKISIINCINTGEKDDELKEHTFTNPNEDDEIFMDGEYLMCVRGWGYLTSRGGLDLSEVDAVNVQDDLVNFILGRLNG